jgi:sporulation protein YlmC with PRC-barrel domain
VYSVKELRKARIFIKNKKGKVHKLGRAYAVVFHPKKAKAVGLIVKRPDLLLMIKRKDWFVALDSLKQKDKNFVVDATNKGAFGEAAFKRLDIDFDSCILWEGMPVATESGKDLGLISNVDIDKKTLEIKSIDVSSGGIDKALVGASTIARENLLGYDNGCIRVKEETPEALGDGGVAAKAGETWAKGKHAASEASAKAGDAINKGAYKTGQAIGSVKNAAKKRGLGSVEDAKKTAGNQLKKSRNMFKEFKEEYKKASRDE